MKNLSQQLPPDYPPKYITSGKWHAVNSLNVDNGDNAILLHAAKCWTINADAHWEKPIPGVAVAVCFREADAKLIAAAPSIREFIKSCVELAEKNEPFDLRGLILDEGKRILEKV